MHCPRLDHFARINHKGKISKCGHMTKEKEFDSFEEMQTSSWLQEIKETMGNESWPAECVRCKMTEETSNTSIRLDMIERDRILRAVKKDYLIIGGVLDNICNSACQTCHSGLSTKIGSLVSKKYPKFNNYQKFLTLPQHRICELDINGGEPSASPNYKKLLKNLPDSVKIVRINTNVSSVINEVKELLDNGLKIIVTMSFDGVEKIHDYVRWPILWEKFDRNVDVYLAMRAQYPNLKLDFWTTVSCLNVGDLGNIISYTKEKNIPHAYGFCTRPNALDIRFENKFTIQAKNKLCKLDSKLLNAIADNCCSFKENNDMALKQFMIRQDLLRNIDYRKYFNESLH